MKIYRLHTTITGILFCAAIFTVALAESPNTSDVESGKVKSVLCSGCHGLKGEGKYELGELPAYPSLAGQIPGYFIKSVHDYKKDIRNDPVMNAISKGLTDADIINLAAYYKSLK